MSKQSDYAVEELWTRRKVMTEICEAQGNYFLQVPGPPATVNEE
jgi:hypothetical protein